MSIDPKLNPRDFKQWLTEAADTFRRTIELEVEAFDTGPDARDKRLEKVKHKKTGYRYFCETYFPHYLTKPNSNLHDALFTQLPGMVYAEGGQKEVVVAPRGSAKSTHTALMFPIFCVALELKKFPVIVMDAFEQAAMSIEAIKAELEVNPRLAQDFPNIVGQGRVWREGDIITRNNIRIEGFGTGKKIRGRRHGPFRPDLAVLDDVENDENVVSPTQRAKLERWIERAVLKLGPPDGSMDVLYAGTILHFDAVIVRFTKKPGWKVTRYQAIMQWPEDMELWDHWEEIYLNDGEPKADAFYKKHKADMDKGAVLNWPANHTLLFLMKERAGGHESFASEFQNKPISAGNPFQKLTYWSQTKRELIKFAAIDPSLGKAGKSRDPSAILIGGVDPITKQLDILHASIRKRLPDVIIADAIALQKEHKCVLWFVESVQFQEFLRTQLMKQAVAEGVALSAIPVNPTTDKLLRIERLQPPTAAGLIRFHNSQTTLIEQLQQFPNADHDDGPDCLEMLWDNALRYCKGGGSDLSGISGAASDVGGSYKDYRMGG